MASLHITFGLLTDQWAETLGLNWDDAARFRDNFNPFISPQHAFSWLKVVLDDVKDKKLWVETYLNEPVFREWSDQWGSEDQQSLLDVFLGMKAYEREARKGTSAPTPNTIQVIKNSRPYQDWQSGKHAAWGAVIGIAKKHQPDVSVELLKDEL